MATPAPSTGAQVTRRRRNGPTFWKSLVLVILAVVAATTWYTGRGSNDKERLVQVLHDRDKLCGPEVSKSLSLNYDNATVIPASSVPVGNTGSSMDGSGHEYLKVPMQDPGFSPDDTSAITFEIYRDPTDGEVIVSDFDGWNIPCGGSDKAVKSMAH